MKAVGASRLTRIFTDEAALYAATETSRYDAGAREFEPLRELLDRQLPLLRSRLVRLAKCNGEAGKRHPSLRRGPRRTLQSEWQPLVDEAETMRTLIVSHNALLSRLRAATIVRAAHFDDMTAAKLLADLIAEHEQDAFALRALLWEFHHACW